MEVVNKQSKFNQKSEKGVLSGVIQKRSLTTSGF